MAGRTLSILEQEKQSVIMLTRGKLAKQTGCHIETIRYYERVGVLPEAERTPSGYRIYNEDHAERLRFILKAKALGFSPKHVQELLELSDGGDTHTRSEVKSLTEAHINEVSEKITDLQKLKYRLNQISSHCDGSSKSAIDCPILISLFDDS